MSGVLWSLLLLRGGLAFQSQGVDLLHLVLQERVYQLVLLEVRLALELLGHDLELDVTVVASGAARVLVNHLQKSGLQRL